MPFCQTEANRLESVAKSAEAYHLRRQQESDSHEANIPLDLHNYRITVRSIEYGLRILSRADDTLVKDTMTQSLAIINARYKAEYDQWFIEGCTLSDASQDAKAHALSARAGFVNYMGA